MLSKTSLTKQKGLSRVLGDILGVALLTGAVNGVNELLSLTPRELVKKLKDSGYELIKSLPFVKAQLNKEIEGLQVLQSLYCTI